MNRISHRPKIQKAIALRTKGTSIGVHQEFSGDVVEAAGDAEGDTVFRQLLCQLLFEFMPEIDSLGVFQCLDGDLPSWCPTMVAQMPDLAGCVVHFVVQLEIVKLNADKAVRSSYWGKWKAAIALFAVFCCVA
ncbi:hypothetical protein Nepgr_002619 [Nepenthes gracilis]|uniref:Uncharacterized protein n=1 Tax=Nepenthes gracilis TaxID=150966 RepID=A0AAD3P425_NEPGR|nr:hypothetical protein Nepgr_002619 [Nepenthes gracilis]